MLQEGNRLLRVKKHGIPGSRLAALGSLAVQKMAQFSSSRLLVCSVLLALFHFTLSKRVLLVTCPFGSHLMQANTIAEGLLSRGHEVSATWNIRGKPKEDMMHAQVNLLRYDTGHIPVFQEPDYERKLLSIELEGADAFTVLDGLFEKDIEECKDILGNKQLEEAIRNGKFDFAVLDGIFRCYVIIPDRHNLPFAVFMAFLPGDRPHMGLQGPLLIRGPLDDMIVDSTEDTFWGKLLRICVTFMLVEPEAFGDFSNKSTADMMMNFSLWLYDMSPVMGTQIPLSPNVIHVGGLNTGEAKPLVNGELKNFVDSSKQGVILVSFGSYASLLSESLTNILIETFCDLPYDFVWKLKKDSIKTGQTLPKNVLAVDWIPQNDLLGHPNLILFITHCGNSGQHEALYNSVPMLGIPLFADQIFNAKRLDTLRLGLHLRVRDLTKEKLSIMITKILTDKSISEAMTKASRIFRDQPMTPKDTAAFWIDHVMQHGADHLKSATNRMSWFEILLLDVLLAVCAVVVLSLLLLYCTGRCLIRCFRRKTAPKIKTS